MKQVLIDKGNVELKDVPAPVLKYGQLLVQVHSSCISSGTELAGIKISEKPLWKKAIQQPDKVVKTLKMTATEGINQTKNIIQAQLNPILPIGYSNSGEIIDKCPSITDLEIGDRVACAGSKYAFHAELVSVPRNLVVKIPTHVDYLSASTITLGAIALQGLRRAQPTIGETFAVIGLGALGQITIQLLKANGCKTVGIDIDNRKVEIAKTLGLDIGVVNNEEVETVYKLTNSNGLDGVIITASSASNEIVSTAFNMCRKKGRVILVGDVGLNLNRSEFYEKELDFFISTSYGPGRYEKSYEEGGMDYPISYVRWTENRNMQEFSNMLACNQVNVKPLIESTYDFDQAPQAYKDLLSNENKPLLVVLKYPDKLNSEASKHIIQHNITPLDTNKNAISLAVIGLGNYAKTTHLPILKSLTDQFSIDAVVASNGHNAISIAEKYNAHYSSTDADEIIRNSEIDAVLIATRHNLHDELVISALNSKKHIFVEKPTAVSRDGLDKIASALESNNAKVLMTGFNRNHSPYIQKLKELIVNNKEALIINYRMNAGYIPSSSWLHTNEGGGRNIGEACHIYALFTFLTESAVKNVQAQSISPKSDYYKKNDNFVVTITFNDGSLATLTYTAMGTNVLPKEYMEVYVDGKVYILDDYRKLNVYDKSQRKIMESKTSNKGQKEILQHFASTVLGKSELLIPTWHQFQAMNIAFDVEEAIFRGK